MPRVHGKNIRRLDRNSRIRFLFNLYETYVRGEMYTAVQTVWTKPPDYFADDEIAQQQRR